MDQTESDKNRRPEMQGEIVPRQDDTDASVEKTRLGKIGRVIRYVSNKISGMTAEEKAEAAKIDGLRKGLVKDIDAMVQTDANIYLLFIRSLKETHASSDTWKLLRQYVDKGIATEAKIRYSTPPRIDYRNFVFIQDMFSESPDEIHLRSYLEILLESDENQFALLARWHSYHMNDLNNILDLHHAVTLVRNKNSDHFRLLFDFSSQNYIPDFRSLMLFLEYLSQVQRYDYEEAQNYIAVNLNRNGPYR